MAKIGFITTSDLSKYFPSSRSPYFTHDDQLAVDFLEAKGHNVLPVFWGTEVGDKSCDLYVVRSPWDYSDSHRNRTQFLQWLKNLSESGQPLLNSFEWIQWNIDKHYLKDLAALGIPVVPTRFVSADEPLNLLDLYCQKGPVVLKPAISAAAKDTFLVSSRKDAEGLQSGSLKRLPFNHIRKDRDYLVQPFISDVRTKGEWSCVFINGQYSHSVLKRPKLGGWLVQDELGGSVHWQEPSSSVLSLAKETVAALDVVAKQLYSSNSEAISRSTPLYGRVDLIQSGENLLVSELELIEPELFFLDRSKVEAKPHIPALELFYLGICEHLN